MPCWSAVHLGARGVPAPRTRFHRPDPAHPTPRRYPRAQVPIILAGLWGVVFGYKYGYRARFVVPSFLMMLVGVGSVAFHVRAVPCPPPAAQRPAARWWGGRGTRMGAGSC